MRLHELAEVSRRVAETRGRKAKVELLSTLRFARVKRYRPDKRASEADTLASVRALLPASR